MSKKESKYIVSGERKVLVQLQGSSINKISGKKYAINVEKLPEWEHIIKINGKKHIGEIVSLKKNRCVVLVNGNTYKFQIDTEESYKQRSKRGNSKSTYTNLKLTAPLPGVISSVQVVEGHKVTKEMPLLILEAMKMQNEIQSPVTGVVKRIFVSGGVTVMRDQLLMEIEEC